MGCDIHYVVEKKSEGVWVGIMATDVNFRPAFQSRRKDPLWQFKERDYQFFAELAGVRGNGPKPNGFPEDASATTKVLAGEWGCDGHSHSHCSLYEFAAAKIKGRPDLSGAAALKLAGKDPVVELLQCSFIEDMQEYRVCFWFDN